MMLKFLSHFPRIEKEYYRKRASKVRPKHILYFLNKNYIHRAEHLLSLIFAPVMIKIVPTDSLSSSEELFILNLIQKNIFILRVPSNFYNVSLIDRFLGMRELLLYLNNSNLAYGHEFNLNLGDCPYHSGFAFSSNRCDSKLIPDTDFLVSNGYAEMKQYFINNNVSWIDRKPIVFWRGSTTGIHSGDWFDLPRIKLCTLVSAAQQSDLFDVGISQVVQIDPGLKRNKLMINLMKNFVPAKELNSYKYHIDIDGNSNAWSGFFLKLLSGGLVFKVDSNFRQWYYDRLKPWVHYVPIREDLSNLIEVVTSVVKNDVLAQKIASEGQRIVMDMSFQNEIKMSVDSHLTSFTKKTI